MAVAVVMTATNATRTTTEPVGVAVFVVSATASGDIAHLLPGQAIMSFVFVLCLSFPPLTLKGVTTSSPTYHTLLVPIYYIDLIFLASRCYGVIFFHYGLKSLLFKWLQLNINFKHPCHLQ